MIRKIIPTLLLLSFDIASFAQTLPPGVRKNASIDFKAAGVFQ